MCQIHACFGADRVVADDPRNDATVSLHHVVLEGLTGAHVVQ